MGKWSLDMNVAPNGGRQVITLISLMNLSVILNKKNPDCYCDRDLVAHNVKQFNTYQYLQI